MGVSPTANPLLSLKNALPQLLLPRLPPTPRNQVTAGIQTLMPDALLPVDIQTEPEMPTDLVSPTANPLLLPKNALPQLLLPRLPPTPRNQVTAGIQTLMPDALLPVDIQTEPEMLTDLVSPTANPLLLPKTALPQLLLLKMKLVPSRNQVTAGTQTLMLVALPPVDIQMDLEEPTLLVSPTARKTH